MRQEVDGRAAARRRRADRSMIWKIRIISRFTFKGRRRGGRHVGDLRARRQAHVLQRAALGGAAVFVGDLVRIRHRSGHRDHVLRAGAPGDDRRQVKMITTM